MIWRQSGRRRPMSPAVGPLAAIALVLAAPACAEPARELSLPAGSLDHALLALAAPNHQQLLYAPELVHGRQVEALAGRFTTAQAIARLVGDDAIQVSFPAPNVVVLKPKASPKAPVAPARAGGDDPRPFVPETRPE